MKFFTHFLCLFHVVSAVTRLNDVEKTQPLKIGGEVQQINTQSMYVCNAFLSPEDDESRAKKRKATLKLWDQDRKELHDKKDALKYRECHE